MSEIMDAALLLELTETTGAFGTAYFEAAKAKDASDTGKTEFYEVADRVIAQRRLAQKTIEVPRATVAEDVHDYVRKFHPGWQVIEIDWDTQKNDGPVSTIIRQDPSQMKFSFTNLEDGYVYQRTYTTGAPQLDDERLREEDPDLWEAITVFDPALSVLVEGAMQWVAARAYNQDDVKTFLEAHVPRVLKPSEEWTKQQSAAVQKYLVPGSLTMKIVKPRKATEEEIAEALAELEAIES